MWRYIRNIKVESERRMYCFIKIFVSVSIFAYKRYAILGVTRAAEFSVFNGAIQVKNT